MTESNNNFIPVISIKKAERNISKTYTDTESNVSTIETIAKLTNRSINDVLKELVNNFIQNGMIYDPNNNTRYPVKEFIENHKSKGTSASKDE